MTGKQSVTLIVDSREPKDSGWEPYFKLPVIRGTLRTGDCSMLGYENQISIERKTLSDLIGCLSFGRNRFERELERSVNLEYFAVLVEAGYSQLVYGDYRSMMRPKAAIESISAFEVRYGTHFLFCGSAELAAAKCESLLLKFHRETEKRAADRYPVLKGKPERKY